MEEHWTHAALTAHEEGLRRLARSLVFSEHEAEDVVQQTYASALAHRGDRPTHEGAWLRAVARNIARNVRRGRGRQRSRERAAARSTAVPSTADAVVRIEERELLLGAVKALEAPHREIIVLRFFDGLPPRRIAERLDCPVATVKSRLQRALARLRHGLDRHHGGERRRWLAAFTPLALPRRVGEGLGTSLLGGLVMSAATRTSIAALVLLLLAGGVWLGVRTLGERDDPVGARSDGNGPDTYSGPALQGRASTPAPPAEGDASIAASPVLRSDGPRVFPAAREPVDLRGRVEDEHGAPVAAAEIVAHAVPGPQMTESAIADDRGDVRRTRSDARGRFALEALREGPYAIRATHGARTMDLTFVAARRDAPLLTLRLNRRTSDFGLRVRAVDESGEPVAGATVEIHGDSEWTGTTGKGGVWRGTTGEDGLVGWPDVEWHGGVVWVRGPEGREGLRRLWLRSAVRKAMSAGAVEVTLAPPGTLEGAVEVEGGVSLEGVAVEAHARTSKAAYYTSQARIWETPVKEGRYRFDALPAGTFHLFVRGGGLRTIVEWSGEGRYPESVQAKVEAGVSAEVDLVAARGGVLRGVVRSGGVPVAGARVRATRDPRTSNVPDGVNLHGVNVRRYDSPKLHTPGHPLTHRWAATDEGGNYIVDALEPGRYRLDVFAPGLSHAQVLEVEIPLVEVVRRDFDLVPAGVLQGAAPGHVYFGARLLGEEDFRAIAILGRARLFTFAGLPPGEYELGFPYWGRDTRIIARATVVAGRTTWVDLSNTGEFGLRARAVAAGVPVRDAEVRLGSRTVRTDGEGRVEIRWPDPAGPGGRTIQVLRQIPGGGVQRWWAPGLFDPGGVTDVGDLALGDHAVSLQTTDSEGRPAVADLYLLGGAEQRPDIGSSSDSVVLEVRARMPPTGVLTLPGCPAHETYAATATFEGEIPVTVSFTVPVAGPVVLRAPPLGALVVELRDPTGAPCREAWVEALTWKGEGAAPTDLAGWQAAPEQDLVLVSAQTNAEGRATLSHVQAGTVWVRVSWSATPWGGETRHARAFVALARGERKQLELDLR